ncbi:hypothetical protein [Vibrio sp. D431a]|uniref:hypothetical protein n=1 Tax=Vibrio sp. D431a TaxID=2837388 RepID=UPI002554A5AD|nr:hypothetical protein [Vibrio sp. D431a]MDK9789755.1 hypothetical protein [Vibrio sp. D431a]
MNYRFTSSKDYDAYTIAVTSHLRKTKLNELRHAMAKVDQFDDVRPYKDALDNQPNNQSIDVDFMRILSKHVFFTATNLVYSAYEEVLDWDLVQSEGFLEHDVIRLHSRIDANKLASLPHGNLKAEFLEQAGGSTEKLAQLTYEYIINWSAEVLVSIIDGALEELEPSKSVHDYLMGNKEKFEAQLTNAVIWVLMDGSMFETE